MVGLDTDLSIIQNPGTMVDVEWVPVPNADPGEDDTPVREQVIGRGATPIPKCEGAGPTRAGTSGSLAVAATGPTPRMKKIAAQRFTRVRSGS